MGMNAAGEQKKKGQDAAKQQDNDKSRIQNASRQLLMSFSYPPIHVLPAVRRSWTIQPQLVRDGNRT